MQYKLNIPIEQKVNIHIDRPPPWICMKWFSPAWACAVYCTQSESSSRCARKQPVNNVVLLKENLVFKKRKERRKTKERLAICFSQERWV